MFYVNASVTIFCKEHDHYGSIAGVLPTDNMIEACGIVRMIAATLIHEASERLESPKDEMDFLCELSPCTTAEAKVKPIKGTQNDIMQVAGAWEKLTKCGSGCVGGAT